MAIHIGSRSAPARERWHGDLLIASTDTAPRLSSTRRALGVALALYVIALQATVVFGRVNWHWPIHPDVQWSAPADVLALVFLQSAPIGYFLGFGLRRFMALPLAAAVGALSSVVHLVLGLWLANPVYPLSGLAAAGGAAFGAVLFLVVAARLRKRARNDAVVIAPDLPLIGGVYLLTPLLWLSSLTAASDLSAGHAWPLALLGLYGASLLASAHANRGAAGGSVASHGLIAAAWFSVGTAPFALVAPKAWLACLVGVTLFAACHAPVLGMQARDRRIEASSVRRALPFLTLYVALLAIAPAAHAFAGREGRSTFWAALDSAVVPGLGVEYVAAFTALGYAAAELRGRDEVPAKWSWRVIGPWLAIAAAVVGSLRLATDGVTAQRGLGLAFMTAAFATAAARLGISVYALQREHARAHALEGRGVRVTTRSAPVERRVEPTPTLALTCIAVIEG